MDECPVGQLFLCEVLLDGFVEFDGNGLPRTKYLVEGSEEERKARETLAILLRSRNPLNRDLRVSLAALFDPAPTGHLAGVRELRFTFRGKKGRRRDHWANTMIAEHVWKAVRAGGAVVEAIASAADRFEKDESVVGKLWRRYRPHFESGRFS